VAVTIAPASNTVSLSLVSKTDIPCTGATLGSIRVAGAGGTAPYEYKIGPTGVYQPTGEFLVSGSGNYTITVKDANGCTAELVVNLAQLNSTVTATVVSQTNIPCAGGTGSVTVAGGGGKAPYTYRISPGAYQSIATFGNLTEGNHTVTVRDADGCTKDLVVSITQIANTVNAVVAAKTDIPCAGGTGSVTVSATGGTAPYTYKLGAGAYQSIATFSNLIVGDYIITVRDANGCTKEITASIVQMANTVSVAIGSKTDVSCAGGNTGALTVVGAGGTAPYQYKLQTGTYQSNPTFTGLAKGNYTVTIRDAGGCTNDLAVVIGETPNTVTATISTQTNVSCLGGNTGSVTIAGGGGTPPYQYKITGGSYQSNATFSNLAAGQHVFTVRDAAGCTKDVTAAITQLSNTVTATVVSRTDISCLGGNSGAVTIAGGGGTAPYQYRINGGAYQGSGVFTGLALGGHTITVSDANGCTSDISIVIGQLANTVTATVAAKTDIPCSGGNIGSVTIAAGGGTAPYQYKLGAGVYQESPTFNNLSAGNHIVTVRDAGGCTKDVVVNIGEINNTVTLTVITKSDIPCSGGTIGSITVAGGGGTAPYEYKLGTGAYQPSGAFIVLGTGNYTITVRDALGCTKELVVNIGQLNSTVTATVGSKTDVSCAGGNTGSVTIVGGGGVAPYTYRLGVGAYQPGGTFNNLPVGDHLITVRDAGGCTKDITVTIGQAASTVTATVTSKTDISCSGGNTGSVTVAGGGGTAPYTYRQGNGAYQQLATFNNLPAGDHLITIRDANGCTKELTVNIVQTANTVTATIGSQTGVLCSGGNTGSVTIVGAGGTAPYTYKLGTGQYQASPTFPNLPVGNHLVTVKDAQGCTKDLAVTVAQQPNTVTATVTAKTDIPCSGGNTGSVTVAGSGGTAPYTYKLGSGQYQPGSTFDKLGAGDYIITIKDASGCTKDTTINIGQLLNTVTATISSQTDVPCSGGNTGSVTVAGSGGTAPYQYKIGNGPYKSSGVFDGLAISSYIVTVRDAGGCTKEIPVAIKQANNTVTATVSSNVAVPCSGGNTGSAVVVGSGGTAPYEYKLGSGTYQASGSFNGLAAGTYTVTVKDAGGCTKEIPVTIEQINNTVTATISSQTNVSCAGGNNGSVTVAGGGGTAPYEYKLGTGAYQASGSFDSLSAGNFIVTVKDASGCTKEVKVDIAAGSVSAGTISPTTVDARCIGSKEVLTASEGSSYQWYRDDLPITSATGRTYTADSSGKYSVVITNGTCRAKASNTVMLTFRACVDTEIFVPKAFTPNNNNVNEKLMPMFINVKQLRYFKVYNRWGQLMFQTNVTGEGWDGMFKGVRQPMETYSWILECVDENGNHVRRSGKTILIR
jgi:gliding motility-associated-like protein